MTNQDLWTHEDEQDVKELEKRIERGEMTVLKASWEEELAWLTSLK